MIEADTHYFIFYLFFHPRDWSDVLPWADEHENDMEGVWLVIQKDGTKYGTLLLMETEAHNQIYQYTNDTNIGSGSDDIDGSILREFSDGFLRPTVFVQAKGYGVYAYDVSEFPGGDGVIYRSHGRAEEPDSGNDKDVSYALIPLFTTLWQKRDNIGNGKTFDAPFTYAKNITLNEELVEISGTLPGAFDGDNG